MRLGICSKRSQRVAGIEEAKVKVEARFGEFPRSYGRFGASILLGEVIREIELMFVVEGEQAA